MKLLALVLPAVLLFACTPPQPPPVKIAAPVESPTLESSVFHEIKGIIANKYFDFRTCPKIPVLINDPQGEVPERPYLREYLREKLQDYFKVANQLKSADHPGEDIKCFLETRIAPGKPEGFSFSYKVIDAVSLKTLGQGAGTFPLEIIDRELYRKIAERIQEDLERKAKIGNTRLMVRCFTDGNNFKASDNYYLLSFRNRRSTKLVLLREDTGFSGHYPANINIGFQGESFGKKADNVILDREIFPGRHEITVSFQEGSWDAQSRREMTGRTYTSDYFIDIAKDDNIIFDVLCNYDGRRGSIEAKAVKHMVVTRQGRLVEGTENVPVHRR